MAYQALYRKYRPRSFDDVVGQEHVTKTLKRQIAGERLSHAYLFVGTRGTGKTTCAKILARALNCEHPVDGNPCNECPSCLGIENGSILDVEELDAASNNGVDNIRSLRTEAIFTPASVKKRVYIVDEVHMLSGSAFNALLKILEEPPEHLVFILATTEVRKVPATILSRCQRFTFRRIMPDDIKKRLNYVAECEGLELTDAASSLLAHLADGSMRDALSLLDQCSSDRVIDEERVLSTVGLVGVEDTMAIFNSILAGNTADVLRRFDSLYFSGKDVSSFLSELVAICRDIVMLRTAPDGCSSLLSSRVNPDILLRCEAAPGKLLGLIDHIQETVSSMSTLPDQRTAAEMCLMRLCGMKAESVFFPFSPAAEPAPVRKLEATSPPDEVPVTDRSIPAEAVPPAMEETPSSAPEVPAGITEAYGWSDLLLSVKPDIDPPVYSFLSDKSFVSAVIGQNTVTVKAKNDFILNMININSVKTALGSAAGKMFGKPAGIIMEVDNTPAPEKPDRLDELAKFSNIKFE